MSENNAPQLTHHAMLIPWGQFAQCLGLIERFSAVSLQQKTIDHSPQTKVIEFLVANLAGLARTNCYLHHFKKIMGNDWHHHIQFELPWLSCQHNSYVASDHLKHCHIEHLCHNQVNLARQMLEPGYTADKRISSSPVVGPELSR